MRGSPRAVFAIGVAALALFTLGLLHLFSLRYERGDTYPPYSSLRTDPLGTRALFESFDAVDGVVAERNFRPFERLDTRGPIAAFLLGATVDGMGEPVPVGEFTPIERVAAAGGRVLVTFQPVGEEPFAFSMTQDGLFSRDEAEEDEADEDGEESEDNGADDDNDGEEEVPENEDATEDDTEAEGEDAEVDKDEDDDRPSYGEQQTVSIQDRWGVALAFEDLEVDEDRLYQSVLAVQDETDELPRSVSWHTALYFDLGPDSPGASHWRTVYTRGDDLPVVIERDYGRGSIVLCADSYFLSNEAMVNERYPALLSWLAGPNRFVVFDESHFGIQEHQGVMSLAWKYRLQGVFAGFVLLAALYVWKNATHFVPPRPDFGADDIGGWVEGKDAATGLKNLLRRTVAVGDLLRACFDEWSKTRRGSRVNVEGKLGRMEAVVQSEEAKPAAERDPVNAYRAISRILSERK
ncbi:MAG: hypothetical protein GY851_09635 [bacterium]|nr:hypothetical protein [bacterium]